MSLSFRIILKTAFILLLGLFPLYAEEENTKTEEKEDETVNVVEDVSFKKEAEMNSLQWAAPKKINLGEISKINVFIPCSKKEQSEIAKVLFNLDAEIEALEQKREKYKQLKIGLMQQLLTGRIRVKW